MKQITFYKQKQEEGFTLILAIFLSTIVLTITLSMMSILYKQLVLSTADRESQIAFFAADTGMECAYYWDFRADLAGSSTQSIFQRQSTLLPTLGDIKPHCAGQKITATDGPTGETPFSSSATTTSAGDTIYTTIFYITNINSTQACTYVVVNKNETQKTTVIESHGQNRCVLGDTRRVERAIQFRY
jgi:Tfp pilus assembly protein PilX